MDAGSRGPERGGRTVLGGTIRYETMRMDERPEVLKAAIVNVSSGPRAVTAPRRPPGGESPELYRATDVARQRDVARETHRVLESALPQELRGERLNRAINLTIASIGLLLLMPLCLLI